MIEFIRNSLSIIRKDDSDDFFVDKHVNKRREEYAKKVAEKRIITELKEKETRDKLMNGITSILMACNNNILQSQKEKLFVEIFSKLKVYNDYGVSEHVESFAFLDDKHNKYCSYDFIINSFWMSYSFAYSRFRDYLDMSYVNTYDFMNEMLKKYFKLDANLWTN